MESNNGYINIVAVMQKFFDQAISGNWSYNPQQYENNEVPVSVMAQDLLKTYKYGWKTSYYQNTYDNKNDELEETKSELESLISQLENMLRRKTVSLVKFKKDSVDNKNTTVNQMTVFNSEQVDRKKQPMFF